MTIQAPLAGKRVMVTRSRPQAGELAELLRQQGGEPYEYPVITIVPPSDWSQVDSALRQIQSYDWILFTSANGILFFFRRMAELGISKNRYHGKIGVVGANTASALEAAGYQADAVPTAFVAESLVEELAVHLTHGQRILLPTSNIARKLLPVQLRDMGCVVTEIDMYQNVPNTAGKAEALAHLRNGDIDCITFTSSSTVRNFVRIFSDERLDQLLKNVTIACIGPITAQTAVDLDLWVDVMPDSYTIAGMVKALVAKYS